MQQLETNVPITSKYKDVIEAVREYQANGMPIEQAAQNAVDKFWYRFVLNDREILLSWFNNKFAA